MLRRMPIIKFRMKGPVVPNFPRKHAERRALLGEVAGVPGSDALSSGSAETGRPFFLCVFPYLRRCDKLGPGFVSPNFPPKLATHLAESVCAARCCYRKRLARCQKKFSQKAVHGLRTETRRILALLCLIEALRFEDSLKKLRKAFKKRLDAFDDLRDTHVQLVLLKPLWAHYPEARPLKKHLCKCEKRLVSDLSREIQCTKSGKLNRRLKEIEKSLRQCADHPPTGRSRALAQRLLGDAFRRVVVLRRQIKRNNPASIHHMRVAFKQFRYTAELLQPFLPQFTPQRLDRMKEFQAAAGHIQDAAVLLARLARDIRNGELEAAGVKNLRGELLRLERRAINSFMERIDELMDFEPEPAAPFASDPAIVSQ
jgi:CHAD domain-containing protein